MHSRYRVFTPKNVENTPHRFSIKCEVYGFLFVSSYLSKFWAFFLLYRAQYRVIFDCDMSRVYSEMMVVVVMMMMMVTVTMAVTVTMTMVVMITWKHLANKPPNNGYPRLNDRYPYLNYHYGYP